MNKFRKLFDIRTRDLLVPTVAVLTIHIICLMIMTMSVINTNICERLVVNETLAHGHKMAKRSSLGEIGDFNRQNNASNNIQIDNSTTMKPNITTSLSTNSTATQTTVAPITITTAASTTVVPITPTNTTDAPAVKSWHSCLAFTKYFIISFILLWIVCIIVETLIVGFAISGTEMNTAIECLIKIKIGLFVLEVLLLIVNISLIGDYIGFSAPDGQSSCLKVPTMKTVVDLTIFNWIILATIFVAIICYVLKRLITKSTDSMGFSLNAVHKL
ncbi:unnamed protein product [Medioppia subpectinata]|uniref:Uncharacterized protein n=1 Tax=Medioppia subpectinata TaxID=1979941 RepID=A0A7R9Q105_9ACAR|nr:unnamed protein product [Medioppia subpectinata]CAG2108695.1 unnamed protein product [Medioppia subpectinata]